MSTITNVNTYKNTLAQTPVTDNASTPINDHSTQASDSCCATNDDLLLQLSLLQHQYQHQQMQFKAQVARLKAEYSQMQEKEISIRAALTIRREHGTHLDQMAAFWQDCEVSKPNKPVPVPRAMLFRGKHE